MPAGVVGRCIAMTGTPRPFELRLKWGVKAIGRELDSRVRGNDEGRFSATFQ